MIKLPAKIILLLSGLGLALTAQADVVSDNFSVSKNFLTTGVTNSIWDGVYFGAGEFPGGANGTAAGNTTVANANTTSNNVLTVTSSQTDWEGAPDDGFFLFKVVNGDFTADVRVLNFDNGAFNTAGLQARAFGSQGSTINGGENFVSWTYFFNQFNIGNYFRTELNGALTQRPKGVATNLWLRLERVGDVFNAYERLTTSDPWALIDTQTRADMNGLPVQVGIIHATFDSGGTTTRTAQFEGFSLNRSSVTPVTVPGSASGITATTNGQNDINLSWTPGSGSDGSVVVVWRGNPLIKEMPADGIEYTGAGYGLGNSLPASNHFVVFSGAGGSATVSNLIGGVTYQVAVYAYAGSGASRTYNRTPVQSSFVGASVPVSLLFSPVASPVVWGSARRVPAFLVYNNGAIQDVTASTVYKSSASNIVTLVTAGRIGALTNGGPVTITASNGIFVSNITVTVVSPSMTHRYSFDGTLGDTNVIDTVGTANGFVVTPDSLSGLNGGGQLGLSGTVSNYAQMPPDLFTNYGAVTLEVWGTDSGGVGGSRFLDFGNDGTHFTYISALAGGGPRGAINDGSGLQNVTSAPLTLGSEHHYVFVLDGARRVGRMFIDGRLMLSNANFTITPEDAGRTVNDWFGRSQANGYMSGNINEIRTYNGVLDSLQVAIDAATGPDLITNTPGALTSITLNINNTTPTAGERQQISSSGTFANVGNAVNLTTLVTYFTTAANVARVDGLGLLTAAGPGTANITAVYMGVTSAPVVVTVAAVPITLDHRYSFTTDASDSIGGANGTLNNNAQIVNGQVMLDGFGTSGTTVPIGPSYVSLPSGLFSTYPSTTIETWYTDDNAGTWNRLWDFGNDTANYLFLTVNPANTLIARTAIRTTAVGEQQVNFRRPVEGVEHLLVYTQDGASQTASVYVDGVLVATNNGVTLLPEDLTSTANMYIGRSQFGGDSNYRGSVNEMRIWRGAISADQVALDYGLGPDALVLIGSRGTFSSLNISVSGQPAGAVQQARALATYTGAANVNVTPFASNWVSSDSTIAKVDQTGMVTGVSAGSATISATYNGTTAGSSVTISAAVAPVLKNRYSFTADASDSVGGANGTLQAGATISGGKVGLTGTANSFVSLPGGLLTGMSNVTIETWVTYTNSSPGNGRLWEFGYAGLTNWFGFSPRSGGGNTLIRYAATYTNAGASGGTLGEITYTGRGTFLGAGSGTTNLHYVVVVNDTDGKAAMYVNGSLYDEVLDWRAKDHAIFVPLDLTKITNAESYIGHTVQTNGTPVANYIGNVDEFRIWNGAMNAAQVAASYQAGPDTVSSDPGAASAISVSHDKTMVLGTYSQPIVKGTFGGGTIDLSGTHKVSFTSDNSSVVQVDGNRIQAVGIGAANVITRYGGLSSTQNVTVVAKALRATHRYSFASDARDSIGGANGTLWGAATIQSNNVVMTGASSPLTYVDLPGSLIQGYDVISIEIWGAATALAANMRLVDFGDAANGTGTSYLSWDPNGSRIFTFGGDPIRNGTLGGGGQAEVSDTITALASPFYVAGVVDQNAKTISYYTNGVLARSVTNANVNLTTIVDRRDFIGRSLFGDPLFNGRFDEIRIYYGGLSSAQIAASYVAGTTPETLSVSLSGNNIIVSWPNLPVLEGYSLQFTTSLVAPNWQSAGSSTVVGGNNQVSVPLTSTPTFFRLIK